MKLIRVATIGIEKYLGDNLAEYRSLKAHYEPLCTQFAELIHKNVYNPADYKWKLKYDKVLSEMKEYSDKLDAIKAPALKLMKEESERDKSRFNDEERKKAELFERCKNDVSFQIKIERAIKDWPRTESAQTAGYILTDGDMLHFSYEGRQRDMDHRYITQDIDELDGGTDGMKQFQIATGAIRMNYSHGEFSFDWLKKPTYPQRNRILDIVGNSEIQVTDRQITDNGKEFHFDNINEMIQQFRWY